MLWRLDPDLGKSFTEWQVGHQVMVPAYRAYARNMPPEKIYFTDPVIVNSPKHAPIASHGHPFFHLPLTPPREGQILTSLALPSHWICLGPSKNELRDPDVSVTNKISLKSELNQVERTLHSDVEDRCDRKMPKIKLCARGIWEIPPGHTESRIGLS